MIIALVPAAGRSRRMGRPKLLLPVDGKPMVTRVVDALLEAGVGELRVVVPPEARELREALAGRPVRFIVNPRPESAMLDSIRCGLAELPPGCRGILVTPADIPGITPPLVRRLIEAFESGPAGKSLVVPVARGRRGHPLIFSAVHVPEVLAGLDDTGLRGLLVRHPARVMEVAASDPAAFADIDTPSDYEAMRRGRSAPEGGSS